MVVVEFVIREVVQDRCRRRFVAIIFISLLIIAWVLKAVEVDLESLLQLYTEVTTSVLI